MSSLRNAIPRRAHKERAQPESRKKFGLLEKHKDYVLRAKNFHKKEETLKKLREKASFRNPDEFYFKMVHTKIVDGIHRPRSEANKYTAEELLVMETQDIGYVLQKLQSEKKKVERLSSALHVLDEKPLNKHVYFAEDRLYPLFSEKERIANACAKSNFSRCDIREEAKEIKARAAGQDKRLPRFECIPDNIKRKTEVSYKELNERKERVRKLEKLYSEMALKKELQKPGRVRKLKEEEMTSPTDKPVYKWRTERKR